ncbi:RNA polymerase sigma factor [Nonomuraea jiangxiensis]|uniref:RNA polymerase sigma-70 factor, ECF subfamily n=1 Tax=Nonomuraea jiangxiensis TaxID=633440 RepID=A0A1G9D5W9_9ACTN|nr:RNA polymerase sigma factor [Nonomuraea jiangxiensis]SDK59329.1 RNA polymerase sigma-70 factor, ECF subfamily [Nonomuraea jiangxiensis]
MTVPATVAALFQEEWGQITATLIRLTGDWDLAEECAQDAFTQALARWPADGVPPNPGAWLTTTARNKAIDRLRRAAVGAAKLRELAALRAVDAPAPADAVEDDRLRLIFTCCHPALPFEARVALTLRTLAGLTTAEIARAFLVPESTMSKRLTRAKRRIREAGIPFRVPSADSLPERLPAVLGVLYLLFTEGYAAGGGTEPVRRGLSDEAIRLARLLVRLLPGEPEAGGLLALMILHDARRPARTVGGELVPLEEQDRSRWRREQIDEGAALLDEVLRPGRAGPYQIQAAIAACHASAPSFDETPWAEIAILYGRLERLVPSPIVRLNRAIAVGMVDPARGLALAETVGPELGGHHLLPAAKADLLCRLGRRAEAAALFGQAVELAPDGPERRHLARRLAEISSGGVSV